MTYTIVGCGDSAKDWIPRGHSIGVNDCWKWGKPTDSLLVCNRPSQFGQHRYKIINQSKPKYFYTQSDAWPMHLPNKRNRKAILASNNPDLPEVKYHQWSGSLYRGTVFYANTSPFTAISLAFHLGAKEIILWGVDMVNHKVFNEDNPETKKEVERYLEMIRLMEEQGCKVYLGNTGTVFDNLIEVYESDKV